MENEHFFVDRVGFQLSPPGGSAKIGKNGHFWHISGSKFIFYFLYDAATVHNASHTSWDICPPIRMKKYWKMVVLWIFTFLETGQFITKICYFCLPPALSPSKICRIVWFNHIYTRHGYPKHDWSPKTLFRHVGVTSEVSFGAVLRIFWVIFWVQTLLFINTFLFCL